MKPDRVELAVMKLYNEFSERGAGHLTSCCQRAVAQLESKINAVVQYEMASIIPLAQK